MVLIRQYDPTADYSALRACFVELQTWEQGLEPGLPAPEDAADPYLAEVFRNCAENSGRIFLARGRRCGGRVHLRTGEGAPVRRRRDRALCVYLGFGRASGPSRPRHRSRAYAAG